MSPLERRTPKRAARRRDTGPDTAVRAIVDQRCGGRCELCDRPLAGTPWSRHHRHPRRMGGTTRLWVNAPSNLLVICGTGTTACHGVVEANRRVSLKAGFLVRDGVDPRTVPVELARGLTWLDDDGMYLDQPPAPLPHAPGAP
ncbi:HNH endonuclease [Nocardioides sp. CPCC 205120]|uniref:HNH endonuclease n=1 Tax=Nocardioides sp. CPCC 205120 TaxID=3406462 RepID=UPI003B50A814